MSGIDRAINGFSAIFFALMGAGFLAAGVYVVWAGATGIAPMPVIFLGLMAMSVGGLGLTGAYAAARSFVTGRWT